MEKDVILVLSLLPERWGSGWFRWSL